YQLLGRSPQQAVSGFLGFTASSRPPGQAKRRRGNRNRKKSWKRWRGPEAELGRELGTFLEDVGLQLRKQGCAGEGSRGLNKGREKPLKIDLILQPDSKVPPPKDILAHQIPNGRKLKRKQRLWEKLGEKGIPLGSHLVLKCAALVTLSPDPLDQALAGQDSWFLAQTKKQPVKRPARLMKKPSALPAVEVISPGGSYNPSFQAHQVQAGGAERTASNLTPCLCCPAGGGRGEWVLREQCEGLLEESDAEEVEESQQWEEAELQADSSPAILSPQAAVGEKKTERQRKREKEAKMLKARQRQEKAARHRHQEVFQLRSIRLQVKRREAELLRRKRAREAKRRAEANKPKRLGKLKYQDPDLDVQLSSELAESLRTLRPEGSILKDRFKSLQKRNLIEPRERAKFRRKYPLKYVEKRAFREIT
uniref:Ribosome biogenesis protein NOP53 n=1 Tax=Sphenodon punctatus TaxID=8508 RepID=A0A8D0GGX0_SPHPU